MCKKAEKWETHLRGKCCPKATKCHPLTYVSSHVQPANLRYTVSASPGQQAACVKIVLLACCTRLLSCERGWPFPSARVYFGLLFQKMLLMDSLYISFTLVSYFDITISVIAAHRPSASCNHPQSLPSSTFSGAHLLTFLHPHPFLVFFFSLRLASVFLQRDTGSH